jgi:hypothetical protein
MTLRSYRQWYEFLTMLKGISCHECSYRDAFKELLEQYGVIEDSLKGANKEISNLSDTLEKVVGA